MAKKRKVKRKVLRQQIQDEAKRRAAAEFDRDAIAADRNDLDAQVRELRSAVSAADHTVAAQAATVERSDAQAFAALGRAQRAEAAVRNILRAAGGGQFKTFNEQKIRAIARRYLDEG